MNFANENGMMTKLEPHERFTRIEVVDSHTGGEPTRVILSGGPNLGDGTMEERRARFRDEFDDVRRAVITEPRASDVWVGAQIVEPFDSSCVTGVIFFNNASVLGMCGHGTIGLFRTLAHLGKIEAGNHRMDTPVGIVDVTLHEDDSVSLTNVPSYRYRESVAIDVEGYGQVIGDVAWGGNWFFLVRSPSEKLSVERIDDLLNLTKRIRRALEKHAVTGEGGAEIDHIELYGQPTLPDCDSKNFVLCPGGAYDRSPCGTGTSAKLACLAADGLLQPGEVWKQESIIGSVFEGSFQWSNDKILPTIRGTAHIMGETTLLLESDDPFRMGIR